MEISTEQLRALFPEITEEEIAFRTEAKRLQLETEKAEKVSDVDRRIQSLEDQLRAVREERAALDAQG